MAGRRAGSVLHRGRRRQEQHPGWGLARGWPRPAGAQAALSVSAPSSGGGLSLADRRGDNLRGWGRPRSGLVLLLRRGFPLTPGAGPLALVPRCSDKARLRPARLPREGGGVWGRGCPEAAQNAGQGAARRGAGAAEGLGYARPRALRPPPPAPPVTPVPAVPAAPAAPAAPPVCWAARRAGDASPERRHPVQCRDCASTSSVASAKATLALEGSGNPPSP